MGWHLAMGKGRRGGNGSLGWDEREDGALSSSKARVFASEPVNCGDIAPFGKLQCRAQVLPNPFGTGLSGQMPRDDHPESPLSVSPLRNREVELPESVSSHFDFGELALDHHDGPGSNEKEVRLAPAGAVGVVVLKPLAMQSGWET